MEEVKTLSIIGYGAFAQLIIKHLQNDFKIVVASRNPQGKDKAGLNFEFVSLEAALAEQFIILGMPAQFIDGFLEKNAHLINPRATVLDVASVKQVPIEAMHRWLPPTCQIIGTHPIFGPGSAAKGIKGLRVVLCPVRCSPQTLAKLRSYLESKDLIVLEKTAAQHDKAMAYVLGLTQYIGRALRQVGAHSTDLTTPAYEDLMDVRRIQGNDSWDIFYSIMRCNPEATRVNNELKVAFAMLDKQLDAE